MDYIKYVNIKQGTKSRRRFSNGNTTPFTQLPFGMVGFAPQTEVENNNWFYHPEHRSLEGVRLTHQPSVWLGDYGSVLLLPQSGKSPFLNTEQGWSDFRPEDAVLRPDYLSLNFTRYGANLKLTPTERGAIINVDYEKQEQSWFSVFPIDGDCYYELDKSNNRITGYTTGHGGDKAVDFKSFFVLQFEQELSDKSAIIRNSDLTTTKANKVSGPNTGISVPVKEKNITIRLAISYVSMEQALLNLEQDKQSFENAQKQAEELWNSYLSRIEIKTDNKKQLETFYSCMYRLFIFPNKCYEIDENGQEIHYSPYDGKIRKGIRYTGNGFWDTYRTVYPLFSIIAKEEYAHMLKGFIQDFKDSGWLPRWSVIGEAGCMPSTLIDAVIADAAIKGIIERDWLEVAFQGMLHHSTTASKDNRFGRTGVESYIEYGYVPYDKKSQSVNLTLDAAYGDFCIAEVAKILGENEIEKQYRKRAMNYKNLFDTKTGFMRAKDSNGDWKEPFDEFKWGGEYCESSAWQATFNVPHDWQGLIDLYGGTQKFIKKLDKLFDTPPQYNVGEYESVIHEMAEMASVDFGQCAISNQPSFYIPYLYAVAGQQEKTDYWIEKICNELFSANDDGFPGDEDNGSMSAWYIFSTLGLYPICPGKSHYVKGKMLVDDVKIKGKKWSNSKHDTFIPYSDLLF